MNYNESSILLKSSYMADWKPYPLYNLAKWKNGLAFRQIDFSKEGIPVVKIAELKNGVTQQTQFTQTEYSDNVKLEYGDMLFSWSGNPETSIDVFWFSMLKGWLNQHIFKVIPAEFVDKHYLFYILKSLKPQFTSIATNKQTTGLGHVTVSDLKRLIVNMPDKSIQRAIAATLSCLDDKIELNNRMNKTLEEMVQAIFKSWFVDFEPFQDGEFVDSELGMIPKGWIVGVLADLLEVKYGKDHKKLPDGDIPVYGSGGLMRYADKAIFTGESVLIPRKGTLSNLMYVNEAFWTVDTMFYTVMKCETVAKYVYQSLLTKDLASMNAGSAVPSMTTDILNHLPVIIPSSSILDQFDSILAPLYACITSNRQQTAKLVQIRSSLLPKLMNGEIHVPLEVQDGIS